MSSASATSKQHLPSLLRSLFPLVISHSYLVEAELYESFHKANVESSRYFTHPIGCRHVWLNNKGSVDLEDIHGGKQVIFIT